MLHLTFGPSILYYSAKTTRHWFLPFSYPSLLSLPSVRFHDLRHTAGTRLSDVGTNATTIAEILGHADLRMTRRYTQVTDPNKPAALGVRS